MRLYWEDLRFIEKVREWRGSITEPDGYELELRLKNESGDVVGVWRWDSDAEEYFFHVFDS